MREYITNFINQQIKTLSDIRNVVLYLFTLIVLAISWSTVKTIQNNYELQKQVSVLKQQNDVLALQNSNQRLQNTYYQTGAYQELAARQNLGLAAPGEKILLVPKTVALKYAGNSAGSSTEQVSAVDDRSRITKNLEAWRDFLLGRQPIQ